MRAQLWPEESEETHLREIDDWLERRRASGEVEVLLAEGEGGVLFGFAELSIRPCAEGCHTQRIAYLEGWYVKSEARQRGVGRALIRAAEDWGRAQGCLEFASDADPQNFVSCDSHLALGFEDAGLVRCFRKDLS